MNEKRISSNRDASHGMGIFSARTIALTPLALVLLYGALIVFPPTRSFALLLQEENHLLEMLTFAFLVLGGALGLALAWRVSRQGVSSPFVVGFYLLFSIGLLIVAMEEVAWGQKLLGFETPTSLEKVNAQDEVTLHNIEGLQGRSEFFRIAFGSCGLIGMWLSRRWRFRGIEAPLTLLPWFLVITGVAGVDLYSDYFPLREQLDHGLHVMSELVEMLIGIVAFLLVWLNIRLLRGHVGRISG